MTNLEKYKNRILDILDGYNADIGVRKGVPVNCHSIDCSECDLCNKRGSCKKATIEWYLEEYEGNNK